MTIEDIASETYKSAADNEKEINALEERLAVCVESIEQMAAVILKHQEHIINLNAHLQEALEKKALHNLLRV